MISFPFLPLAIHRVYVIALTFGVFGVWLTITT